VSIYPGGQVCMSTGIRRKFHVSCVHNLEVTPFTSHFIFLSIRGSISVDLQWMYITVHSCAYLYANRNSFVVPWLLHSQFWSYTDHKSYNATFSLNEIQYIYISVRMCPNYTGVHVYMTTSTHTLGSKSFFTLLKWLIFSTQNI